MTINEYQRLSSRTINDEINIHNLNIHALQGMMMKFNEIETRFQNECNGQELNEHDAQQEVGTLLWFITEFATVNGWNLEEIAEKNIKHLKLLYPDKF